MRDFLRFIGVISAGLLAVLGIMALASWWAIYGLAHPQVHRKNFGPFESPAILLGISNWLGELGLATNTPVSLDVWIGWERPEMDPLVILQVVGAGQINLPTLAVDDYERMLLTGLQGGVGELGASGDRRWLGLDSLGLQPVAMLCTDAPPGIVMAASFSDHDRHRCMTFIELHSLDALPVDLRDRIESTQEASSLFQNSERLVVHHAKFTASN